ncbi:MAG: bifunctional UDP-N-acetylglucosamine diphosphorylase/glucosamine-1-phosphate N-acetyltransferase GlmU [Chloroflexi bacterium]|nr:bifunctional UDP-N-acetylglucosamine diphosphorylase/glucosamine-1-phosphate N-acetyltransferase GlmU [Chloroflexota bacterium]
MTSWAAIVLAAGKGTRMKSRLPKVLHCIGGKEMVRHVIDALGQASIQRVVVVVGHESALVRDALGDALEYAEQAPQLGTGHAAQQARPILEGRADQVLVINGDVPLITSQTLDKMVRRHLESGAVITLLTTVPSDPAGLGRIVRDGNGEVVGIMEEKEAAPSEKALCEVNSGVYCFGATWLWPNLERLRRSGSGELYLTDLIGLAARSGQKVEGVVVQDADEVMGINNRVHLAAAEGVVQQRTREKLMLEGVTLVDPASAFIDATARIAPDTVILPNTMISGETSIGGDCEIGPNSVIRDSRIGRHCRITASVIEEATLENEVEVGPFSHIRAGSYLATGVHVGNFGETKQSRLGRNTRMGHFSYIGDAEIGDEVNIGAGTITCNYDGVTKHRTVVGDHAFIGSDSMLVAPVRIGERAVTGAGSVVNKDVPADKLAVGVPARIRAKRPRQDTY